MDRRRIRAIVLALAAGGGVTCVSPPKDGQVATVADGWYRGDLHFHTNYSDDAKRQGGDDLALALRIADSYRDPQYLAAFPERAGSALDFVAVTDHRTDAALSDPAFRHDHLIVIPGEEYGGSGHAIIAGLKQHVPHDPQAGETPAERHVAAVAEAHAQGAVFSINHPTQENAWTWPVETVDAVEVWNAPWTAFWSELTEAGLDDQVAGRGGEENPYIRAAVRQQGVGPNHQAMWLWYGMLTRGLHPAAVGGGDRHMIVMPGLPTTYVRRPDAPAFADRRGRELGPDGIVEGIRAGGTFVSRGPHAAQVVLEAEGPDGKRHPLGSELAGPGPFRIHVKVGRAAGGLLRLVGGAIVAGTGPVTPEPQVLLEMQVPTAFFETAWSWAPPAGGGWLHAIVFEPRVAGPLDPPMQQAGEALSTLPEGRAGMVTSMLNAMGPLLDTDPLFDGAKCVPAEWEEWPAWCVPVDLETLGTFYLPDQLERFLNTVFVDGRPTEWAMGALTSAFVAR